VEIIQPGEQQYAKVLIFGPSGQGKTVFLGTAQEDDRTSPMLLLSFEGGHSSLAGLDIEIAPIKSWEDYNEVYDLLTNENHGYKSIGIDSISETHTFALLDILNKQGESRRDPDLIEQGDYGKASTQMRRFLRTFRDLPVHVFYTALAKEIKDPRAGMVKVPAMAGQLAEEVPGIMDTVGYLAIEPPEEDEDEEKRILLLKNYPKFRTKVRTPWQVQVPDEIENPTITSLMDTLGFDTPKKGGKK
jgi:hypothetical protein